MFVSATSHSFTGHGLTLTINQFSMAIQYDNTNDLIRGFGELFHELFSLAQRRPGRLFCLRTKHWILVSTSSSLETNIVKVIRVRSRLCFSHHSKAPVDTPAANRMIDVLIDRDGVLRFREGRDIFTPREMATRLANLLESLRHETTA